MQRNNVEFTCMNEVISKMYAFRNSFSSLIKCCIQVSIQHFESQHTVQLARSVVMGTVPG